uniref:CSON002092 protein n=1 Tax=Culicoides sonorensis TaxID=179676 RepID=A0A336MW14_CULSO
MFLYKIIFAFLSISLVNGRPQFITFDNGKIGVNFAGYHAEAGLGGLLTGNAAHGGLSASAGTPFGQKAGAGLGGTVGGNYGRTAGGLYAGASDGFGQGASAALGGKVDEYGPAGGSGAEAHAQGVSKKTVKLGQGNVVKEIHSVQYPSGGVSSGTVSSSGGISSGSVIDTRFHDEETVVPVVKKKVIHKEKTVVRPHKVRKEVVYEQEEEVPVRAPEFDYKNFLDFGFFSNLGAQYGGNHYPGDQQVIVEKTYVAPIHHTQKEVVLNRRIDTSAGAGASAGSGGVVTHSTSYNTGGSFFNDIFNIPISTLQAVNSFLNNRGGVVTKTKTVAYA